MHFCALLDILHIPEIVGISSDESDLEWEEHVTRNYGNIARLIPAISMLEEEAGLDVMAILQNTLADSDNLMEDVLTIEANRDDQAARDEGDSDALEDLYGDSSDSEEDLERGDPLATDRQAFGDLRRLHKAAMLPLFENSPMTSLEGNLFVLNIARANKHSNVSMSQLFAASIDVVAKT